MSKCVYREDVWVVCTLQNGAEMACSVRSKYRYDELPRSHEESLSNNDTMFEELCNALRYVPYATTFKHRKYIHDDFGRRIYADQLVRAVIKYCFVEIDVSELPLYRIGDMLGFHDYACFVADNASKSTSNAN